MIYFIALYKLHQNIPKTLFKYSIYFTGLPFRPSLNQILVPLHFNLWFTPINMYILPWQFPRSCYLWMKATVVGCEMIVLPCPLGTLLGTSWSQVWTDSRTPSWCFCRLKPILQCAQTYCWSLLKQPSTVFFDFLRRNLPGTLLVYFVSHDHHHHIPTPIPNSWLKYFSASCCQNLSASKDELSVTS